VNEKFWKFLPDETKKLFDSGFEGIEKNCPKMQNIIKPIKRKRGQIILNQRDKERNKRISKKRVKIENAFAGVKRLRAVWDVFRNIKYGFADKVFLCACGVWNFHLDL
jgi:hypothetical protein